MQLLGRVSAHGAIGQMIMVDPSSYFSFHPIFYNGVPKVVECFLLSVG